MIQAKFGLVEIALRTLEVYTTATLEKTLGTDEPTNADWRETMDRLAESGRIAYRATVYDDPDFFDYFRAATPEGALASLNVGSRPAHRAGSDKSLATLRAIPWQFAWTQTRLLAASWLGLDAALESARQTGEMAALREMYRSWPFFRVTLDLMEMVLAKADPRIASQYERPARACRPPANRRAPSTPAPHCHRSRPRRHRTRSAGRRRFGAQAIDRREESVCRSDQSRPGGAAPAHAERRCPHRRRLDDHHQRHRRRHAQHRLRRRRTALTSAASDRRPAGGREVRCRSAMPVPRHHRADTRPRTQWTAPESPAGVSGSVADGRREAPGR